jgi:hypothetical protein
MTVDPNQRIAGLLALASSQAGVVTSAQARNLGYDAHLLPRLAATGLLCRESRGNYRVTTETTDPIQRYQRAIAGSMAVISHQSAAALHGILRTSPPLVEVTILRPHRAPARASITVHVSRTLSDIECTTKSGIRVTTPERTLLDLARPRYGWTEARLRKVVGVALGARKLTAATIGTYLSARERVEGVRRLRDILRDMGVGEADSVPEQLFLELLRRSGVELPQPHYIVRDERGDFVAVVDGAYPHLQLAVEIDGYAVHAQPSVFNSDRPRGNELLALGWRVIRFTPHNLTSDPDGVVDTMRRVLQKGGPHEAPAVAEAG